MENKLQYCIWGCANRGKHIFQFMEGKGIRAFIDSNPELQGSSYQGVPIISFDRYMEAYRDCLVVISTFYQHEIVEILERNHILYLSALLLPPEIVETPFRGLYDIAEKKLSASGTLYFYGLNLYSLLLLEHFREKGRCAKIIAAEKEGSLQAEIGKVLGAANFASLDEAGDAPLYITSNEYSQHKFSRGTPVNLYDFLYDIEENYRPYLEKYRGLHKGKRCFIVGTGPSLRIEDLDTLAEHGEICISVNGIIRAYSSTKWRPDYYMLGDKDGIALWKDELVGKCRTEHMLFADRIEGPPDYGFETFHLCRLQVNPQCPPAFTRDFAWGCYTCSTITYCALQFAAYLGCSAIYLYGIDFDSTADCIHFYSKGHNSFSSGRILPDKIAESQDPSDPSNIIAARRAKLGYLSARQAAEERGFKIYNASRHTKLDVFERVDFDSLFGGGPVRFL